MKKYYQLMILGVPLLFLLVHIYSVSAASGVAAYYVGPGEAYVATLDGRARKITNATSYTLFVPVRTLTEQQSFLNNLPAGVTALTNACEWETTAILWGTGYPIVGIGNQCWMRDNLNYATGSSWCYANNAANCNTYGRLYNWSTAITACPSGWHLPSDAEWKTLEMHLGMTQAQADATGWRGTNQGSQLSTLTLNGTNSSGFTALMSGYRDTNSSFYSLDSRTHFWSSTESGSFAWRRSLGTSNFTVGRNTDSKKYGFSVRCLRN
jgi:uncharacterized protein (TIGR02145 family)